MKTLKLLILLFCLPLTFHAQRTLTGLWTGTLSNDSSTVRKNESFEIALTQYKQKVYGYTRSAFIVNDTLFYVVKRVKGTIDGNICEVKDDETISSNFRGRVDKGVKVTTIFRMNQQDSTWHLDGEWKTNRTKNYYSITGKVELREETNLDNSKLFPHLDELNVSKNVEFYTATKKSLTPPVTETKKQPKKTEEPIKKTNESLAKQEEKKKPEEQKPVTKVPTEIVKKEPVKSPDTLVAKKSVPVEVIKTDLPKVEPIKTETAKTDSPVVVAKPEVKLPSAAAFVETRKTVPPQVVTFHSDSLELALYDNGEVDGDTVSVLLNGELILTKQGLKTTAIKKTIQVAPGMDEITLILYAENLGKYPPNTGLLVVHDGEDVYQVRFTADLQQNAAVVFRRKKK